MGMALVTPDLRWILINPQLRSLLGYSQAELRYKPCRELIVEASRESVEEFRRQLLHGELQSARFETQFVRGDGSHVDVEIRSSLLRDNEAKRAYFIDLIDDITDIKQARQDARNAADVYRDLVECAFDHAIFRIDLTGRITTWSTGAKNVFNYSDAEIIGKPVSIIFTAEDHARGQDRIELTTALTRGRADDDRWHVRKDGSRFWSSGVVTPIIDEDGKPSGFVKILRDLTDRKLAQERTLYLAQHDTLTSLPNKKKFRDELVRATESSKHAATKLGVLFIDLDHFKYVNDTLGHHVGDALLVIIAQRLTDSVRRTDICARLGGDEFGVIFTSLSSQEAAYLAEDLISALSQPVELHGHHVIPNASVGITLFPDHAEDPELLLRYADMAMYHAKSKGRNRFVFYSESFDVEARRRSSIEEALRQAIAREDLFLCYQPQVSLDTRTVYCMEALLRSKNPELSLLKTEEFIALADETGLIVPIGEWVLTEACQQLKLWQQNGFSDLRVAINVSPRQLRDGKFSRLVDRVLADHAVDPATLELEITERLLMEDIHNSNAVLRSLKSRGVRISVDDFGTGFSSLSSLRHFPVDTLKIDKVFVKCLPESQHDAAIASAITGMAHSLDLAVVAEGIETESQCAFLSDLGCQGGQGFLFGEPLLPEQIGEVLLDRPRA